MVTYLHDKHGVNPTITTCFFCGKDKDILLVGRATNQLKKAGVNVSPDGETPMHIGVMDKEPCNECKEFMKQGIMLISVRDNETDLQNPYRTGRMAVVRDSLIEQIVDQEDVRKAILTKRMAFIPDASWTALGLPQEDIDNRK